MLRAKGFVLTVRTGGLSVLVHEKVGHTVTLWAFSRFVAHDVRMSRLWVEGCALEFDHAHFSSPFAFRSNILADCI